MNESLYLITGILIGAISVWFLRREEIANLRADAATLRDLLNKRLGYRVPETPEQVEDRKEKEREQSQRQEDDFPDLFKRQADSIARTEAERQKQLGIESEILANSGLAQ